MLVCKVKGQKDDCFLVQELRLRTLQRVDGFFSFRVEGGVKLF